MGELTFSGHETFHCRPFWLKKGYDFLEKHKGSFNNENAVVTLGVGKNMVTAINYWLKAYDILNDEGKFTEIANLIFSDNGLDPFLEDEGTLWLLHYHLHQRKYASIFNLIFSELRKSKPEFTFKIFQDFIQREKGAYNSNTLKSDFTVFHKTYFGKKDSRDIEESFTGLLTELNLLVEIEKTAISDNKAIKKSFWVIERKNRPEIPALIILYAILKNPDYGVSISFEDLYDNPNSVGTIFALSKDGLVSKLEELQELKKYEVVFSNEAGIRELQFKGEKPNPLNVLKDYYESK